ESSQHTTTAVDIAATRLPSGTIALWWLGQASFVLRGPTSTFFIDPFLSTLPERRLVPPPFAAEESPPVDYVLCTHEHGDHLDLPALDIIARRSPAARFIVPRPIVGQLIEKGVAADRIQGVQPDEEIVAGEARIIPTPAMHGLNCPPTVYDFGFE